MAYRNIPHEVRVKATKEVVIINPNIEEIAEENNVSVSFLERQFKKVHDSIDETIEKDKPGPKTTKKTDKEEADAKKDKGDSIQEEKKEENKKEEERPACDDCGSTNVVKNGRYTVKNHLVILLATLLPFLNTTKIIQRWLCTDCGHSVHDEAYKRHVTIRDILILAIGQLALILVFKHGLSIRAVSDILKRVFGFHGSIGYVHKICKRAGKMAKEKMDTINMVQQFRAKLAIFDETFPRVNGMGTANLGAMIDENGLIRGVGFIENRTEQLNEFFKSIITSMFQPLFFLSDFDPSYPKVIQNLIENISIWKDTVHAKRNILRSARSTLKNMNVKTRGKITKKKQKEINALKRKLIGNQLYPILFKMFKGFEVENASISYYYFESGLQELKELAMKFPSLEDFYQKTEKFVTKYMDTLVQQMEIAFKEDLPSTSNSVESKNSLFSIFRKRKKAFGSTESMVEFFSAVALMENYDIKTRGINQGTNAMMRAGIDLDEFGGQNFFEAIKIDEIIFQNSTIEKELSIEDICHCLENIKTVA